MAVSSVTVINRQPPGAGTAYVEVTADAVLSNSYIASGETLSPASLGLTKIIDLTVVQQPANGFYPTWDGTKLRLWRTGAAVAGPLQECPGATDTSGTYRVKVGGTA